MSKACETSTLALLIGQTSGRASLHAVDNGGVLTDVCYVLPQGRKYIRMLAQAPRMLAVLKVVADLDLPADALDLVSEVIAAANLE